MGGFYYVCLKPISGARYQIIHHSQNGNFDPFFHFELFCLPQNGNFDRFFHFELFFLPQN